MHIESVYATREIVELQAPTLGAGIVFVVLTGLACSLDAFLTWQCYRTGKRIMGQAIPKWQSVLAHVCVLGKTGWAAHQFPPLTLTCTAPIAISIRTSQNRTRNRYIWCLNLGFWVVQHIPTQVWMRGSAFHTKLMHTAPRRIEFVAAFVWLLIVFFLHIGFSLLFIVVFMRSLNHLVEASLHE